eukprot:1147781-Pelagomonas_calceolata.AAC.3
MARQYVKFGAINTEGMSMAHAREGMHMAHAQGRQRKIENCSFSSTRPPGTKKCKGQHCPCARMILGQGWRGPQRLANAIAPVCKQKPQRLHTCILQGSFNGPGNLHITESPVSKLDPMSPLHVGHAHARPRKEGIERLSYRLNARPGLFVLLSAPHPSIFMQVRLHWREAEGPCKARALAAALWNGEEFMLQIDAHMRSATCCLLPGTLASMLVSRNEEERVPSIGMNMTFMRRIVHFTTEI